MHTYLILIIKIKNNKKQINENDQFFTIPIKTINIISYNTIPSNKCPIRRINISYYSTLLLLLHKKPKRIYERL